MIKAIIKHSFKNNKGQIILSLVAIAVIFFILIRSTHWNEWIDRGITLSTLLIAIFVWTNERIESWQKSLPKKLNIQYILNGKIYATVENAPLAGDDDIRNWGQSIGQTILNKQTRIEFSGFKTEGPFRDNNKLVLQYRLTVYLFNAIPGIKPNKYFYFDDDGNLSEENRKEISAQSIISTVQN